MIRFLCPAALALALTACSGKSDPPTDDPVETDPETTAPVAGQLMVGAGKARMPVPLGIGTAGFGGFTVPADPTPFASLYPGTTAIHNHPDFRALAISRGEGFELIFLRSDTVGMFQQFRRAVVLELLDRTGRDYDHALIIGATHTHSGPGRVIDGGELFNLIADEFFPEFYNGMVGAMADAVEAALSDLQPGRVGIGSAENSEAINDRRCDDGETPYVNGRAPLIAIEQEGEITALMLAYSIHGTVLNIDELTLSQDVSGGIEQALEDRFDHPVQVQMQNSWGADISPATPEVPSQEGAPQPDGYDQMEAVGQSVADSVVEALDAIVWHDEPEIVSHTHRVPIDREAIGYEGNEFYYPYGGVYCGSSEEDDCDPTTRQDDLDEGCLGFTEEFPAPNQTEFTSGQLADLHFVTFPGEPGTLLAEQVVADMQALGAGEVLFLGYAQDYLGYSLLEDDWWNGGYEASGGLWGPRQGEYLATKAVESYELSMGLADYESLEPVEPFGTSSFEPWVADGSLQLGTVLTNPEPSYTAADTVTLTVAGSDPWLGAPTATLQDGSGTPVARPNQLPVTSDGQAFWISLAVDPPYTEEATERTFQWSFHMPVSHNVVGAVPELSGDYKLQISIPTASGSEEVESAIFTIN